MKKDKEKEQLVEDAVKKDWLKFITDNKFQWFLIIVGVITFYRWIGYVQPSEFVGLFKWAIGGLFFSEGLNQATNFGR